jgi:phosphoglycerate dehydrogenase-like enzyme
LVAVVDCEPDDEQRLARLVREAPARIALGPASAEDVAERAAGASVLVTLYTYTPVDAGALDRLPALRLVATRTAGCSHIDVAAAAARGVAVANVPAASAQAVAEYVFGSVIALRRRLFEARESTRRGEWDYLGFRGSELAGTTLGVIGLGHVGRRVARLGAAFGMRVIGWSRTPVPDLAEPVDLDALLGQADVVVSAVALTDETRGLLGRERLGRLRPSAVLVNAARGGILDEEALVALLLDGRLAGAVLDVLAEEPPDAAALRRIAAAPNVLVTPHVAWHTEEALVRQFEETTDNVLAFLAGTPRNLVAAPALV